MSWKYNPMEEKPKEVYTKDESNCAVMQVEAYPFLSRYFNIPWWDERLPSRKEFFYRREKNLDVVKDVKVTVSGEASINIHKLKNKKPRVAKTQKQV